MSVTDAMQVLSRAGFAVHVVSPEVPRLLAVKDVARALGMSTRWVRDHLGEFPGRTRLPGGDVRIPVQDVVELVERGRMA
jgi:hypothetical protein